MKILLSVLTMTLIGWPALIVGYLVAAIKNGYSTGAYVYNKHEDEMLNKFAYKAKAGRKE